jgi:hypothetical protein
MKVWRKDSEMIACVSLLGAAFVVAEAFAVFPSPVVLVLATKTFSVELPLLVVGLGPMVKASAEEMSRVTRMSSGLLVARDLVKVFAALELVR